jgi:hypothetical protein
MTFTEWIEAQEAGVAACDHITFGRKVWEEAQRFEREACAKVCEANASMPISSSNQTLYNMGVMTCANAIRARGNK